MFEKLPESRPTRERSMAQVVVSSTVHAALVAAAISATQAAASGPPEPPDRAAVAYLMPPRQRHTPSNASAATTSTATATAATPAPQGFTTLTPPRQIPVGIPPVDLGTGIDARAYEGRGVAGGQPDGVAGVLAVEEAVYRASYRADQVDEPADLVRAAPLRYPPALEAVGLTGSVTLEFIVTAGGRADPASVRVMASTDPRFEASAREAVLASGYRPARMRGEAVAQLVRQTLRFMTRP